MRRRRASAPPPASEAEPASARRWLAPPRPQLLLTVAALAFCGIGIGSGSLRTYDEAIYAQVAREIHQSGEWLSTTWNGSPWHHKPPLALWMMAAAYRLLGVSEASVRLASSLSGVATVLGLYFLASALFDRRVALTAALVLLSTPHFLELSKVGMLDVPLTFFVTVSLLSYALALRRPGWVAVSAVAFALAALTKGPAALVAPVACGIHLVLTRRWDLLRSIWTWLGGVSALAIVLPWHLHQWRRHGEAFVDEYLGYHVVRRSLEVLEGHDGSPFFYLKTLAGHQLPWVALLLVALPFCVRRAWADRRPELTLVLVWAGTVLGALTAIATKISWYVLPAYPALSLCIALWLVHTVPERHFGRLVVALLAVLGLQGIAESRVFDLDYTPRVKALALQAGSLVPPGGTLLVAGSEVPTVRFYAERRVEAFEPARPDAIRARLAGGEAMVAIVRGEAAVDTLRGELGDAELPVVGRGGEDLLLRLLPSRRGGAQPSAILPGPGR